MDLANKKAAVLRMLDRDQTQRDIIKTLGVSRMLIWRAKKVFGETGKTLRKPGQGRKHTVRTRRLVKAVASKIWRNPAHSMNTMAKEYNMSSSTMMRVVNEDLEMVPYKHKKKQCCCQ